MAKARRSNDWGFPRWRGYSETREAEAVRQCDRVGCDERGDCPAPKSPNSKERWYFCPTHAGEYNRNWDYFAGLNKEEAEQRAREEKRDAGGYQESAHYAWAGPGDGSRSRDEMRALDLLGLDPDTDFDAAKKAWRELAKRTHPDVNPGNSAAAAEFQAGQAAYDVLKSAAERKQWQPG